MGIASDSLSTHFNFNNFSLFIPSPKDNRAPYTMFVVPQKSLHVLRNVANTASYLDDKCIKLFL